MEGKKERREMKDKKWKEVKNGEGTKERRREIKDKKLKENKEWWKKRKKVGNRQT